MKVLLTTPPGNTTERWPPLGLLYLASNIKKYREDEVRVVDAFCMNLDSRHLVDLIKSERPDFVGLSTSTHTFLESIRTLEAVHRELPDVKIALGGYHSTFTAGQILEAYPFVDYIFKGEAEQAIVKALDCIDSGRSLAEVEGISYMEDGAYIHKQPALIKDLDTLPFPDRNMLKGIDYGYVFKGIPLTFGKFTTMNTSRGCPYTCTYCSCATFSRHQLRYRSAENVVEELEMLYREGYRNAVIVDDNFTHKLERVERICDLILAKKIHMRLYCEGRVDKASPALMRKMKKAGFDAIFFGAESASKRVLDYYHKKTDPGQIITAVENAKKANLLVITSFIMGAPIEQKEDMEATIDLIRKLKPHGLELNTLDVLIGTALWDEIAGQGNIKPEDWKTNHRIYEYNGNGTRKAELDQMISRGYRAYIEEFLAPAAWPGTRGSCCITGPPAACSPGIY